MGERGSSLSRSAVALAALGLASLAGCTPASEESPDRLRIGHFPNVTHAQGLIAHRLSRQGKGWFEERLGVPVEWHVFNAGPSAMEALFAHTVDAVYVGPNPALNAYIRSRGEEVRVVAGAAFGGAALVVRKAAGIDAPADFRGRRVGTPQFGNTQDVACRAWLKAQGFALTTTGGDVSVIPTPNPDLRSLFERGDLDAAWTTEPWVSILERECGARTFLLEEDALTTVLAASRAFTEKRPELVRKLVAAHAELTHWIVEHPEEARAAVAAEVEEISRHALPADLLAHCWPRLVFRSDIDVEDFEHFARAARDVGFLPEIVPLDRLVLRP